MISPYWLPWTNNHLIHSRCLEIAKEARESGKYLKVRIGSTITEGGQKYSKVFLLMHDYKPLQPDEFRLGDKR